MQPGVREAGLGLHPGGAQTPACGALRGGVDQRADADAARAARSVNAFRVLQEALEARELRLSADQRLHARNLPACGARDHLRDLGGAAAGHGVRGREFDDLPARRARARASRRSRVATTNHAGTGPGPGRARRARRPGSAAASRPSPARRRAGDRPPRARGSGRGAGSARRSSRSAPGAAASSAAALSRCPPRSPAAGVSAATYTRPVTFSAAAAAITAPPSRGPPGPRPADGLDQRRHVGGVAAQADERRGDGQRLDPGTAQRRDHARPDRRVLERSVDQQDRGGDQTVAGLRACSSAQSSA